jgi:hypothetical protein
MNNGKGAAWHPFRLRVSIMPKRRKTADERSQERYEAEQRAWDKFRPKLAALNSYADAVALAKSAPPHSDPGRPHYSNLGFFLQHLDVPHGSNATERNLYLQLLQIIDAEGLLKPGVRERVEQTLRAGLR